jgi:hypothetical protein
MKGQDSFVRANQSGFGTASNGESWTASGGTLSIASNKGVIVSDGADAHIQLGSQTGTDMIVQCLLSINNVNDICGIEARFTAASGTSCYKLLFYGGDVHINKSVTGSGTNLANFGGLAMTLNTLYAFKLSCVGTKVKGKVWVSGAAEPDWLMSVTDSSVASGGFALLGQTNGGSTGVQCSSFLAASSSSPVVRPLLGLARRIV